ncbi:PEF-CTERM sorting domain-containing protein [uncultured Methanolobus sp.]|uniref:PEF-CTERM sorting domain-containing protein n=1 Tax=uncultured Methanolobus sp. TaxID=218300 RepID=UPI002AAB078E|nr:PEF-CTERM sorting domain-containing protein [uncultured Methanolobus sp.]
MKKILTTILVLAIIMPLASAMAVPSGTPNCDIDTGNAESEIGQVGTYTSAYKLEDWNSVDNWTPVLGNYPEGTQVYTRSFTEDGNTITIKAYYNTEEKEFYYFDWTSTCPLGVVLVKAGSPTSACYNVYTYDDETSGFYLEAVDYKGISHTTFGWDRCQNNVPEFPTIALPIAAIIGLAFIMQRRKE